VGIWAECASVTALVGTASQSGPSRFLGFRSRHWPAAASWCETGPNHAFEPDMDSRETLQVLFCDLCNTSVPLSDVQSGAAVQHAGKTIGSCCLPVLRGSASPATAAGGEVAAASRSSSEGRVLSLGVVLLGAIAVAVLFLDFRLGEAEERTAKELNRLQETLKAQADVVQDTSVKLDSFASRSDLDRIEGALTAMQAMGEQDAARARELGTGLEAASASLRALQMAMQRMEAAKVDYGPALDDVRRQLQEMSAALSELAAKPRASVDPGSAVADPMPAPKAPEMDATNLPAAILHQVRRLADMDEGTRFEAVDELVRSKDARVLPNLLPMAKDPDAFVRRLVVEGLKDFPSKETVDVLVVALADPEQIVRSSAWLSLKALTKQDLPFDAAASRDARQKAQAKWQEWWEKSRATFGG
jgi:hypothetical protein